jgi:hypothetical protein
MLEPEDKSEDIFDKLELKIATARCARLSYNTHDGEINYEKDIKLHDKLLKDKHMSPMEHCAKVMSNDEYNRFTKGYNFSAVYNGNDENNLTDSYGNDSKGWCDNFKGFISYRYLVENNE